MKKILTTMIFTALLVCSSHVYSHDIGVKKNCTEFSTSIIPVEYNAVASEMNYEFAFNSDVKEVSFIYVLSKVKNSEKYVDLNLKTYRSFIFISYIKDYTRKINNYAIAPSRLYLQENILKYPIVKATPLPKHYLLPCKNEFWYFGSNQRNC